MIASLRGKAVQKDQKYLVVEVGGIGYKVICPKDILDSLKIDSEIRLFTYTQVREDILALYGFKTLEDLTLFESLLGVSGIGPKAAINILSAVSGDRIIGAIEKQDPAVLYSVSGIGKKTAEKIVIELKNKLGVSGSFYQSSSETEDLCQALRELGFKDKEIQKAVANIPEATESTEEKLKIALKEIKK